MGGREDYRLFVGGLAWETSERQLEDAFGRYGKITECLVVADRETGRSRGFGFVTYSDHRSMDTAIRDMNGCELDGRVISVNKAKPKQSDEETRPGYGRDYIPGGGRRVPERFPGGTTDCFKCGRPGHFARECPMSDSSGNFREISDRRGDRTRMDPYERRDSRYGERYGPARDNYSEGYGPARESYADERYVDRPVQSAYGRERGYFREGGLRPSGERFGNSGPERFYRGSYRERVGPYDRPRRGDQISSYDRY